jgi:hypothetical protein
MTILKVRRNQQQIWPWDETMAQATNRARYFRHRVLNAVSRENATVLVSALGWCCSRSESAAQILGDLRGCGAVSSRHTVKRESHVIGESALVPRD